MIEEWKKFQDQTKACMGSAKQTFTLCLQMYSKTLTVFKAKQFYQKNGQFKSQLDCSSHMSKKVL